MLTTEQAASSLNVPNATRLAVLVRTFHRAVARQRAFDAEVLRVLDTPRFREIVVDIVDEVIKTRIGVV